MKRGLFVVLTLSFLATAWSNPALYREAAEGGDAEAQFALAACYATGKGVDRDLTKAAEWLGKAAEQGHKTAQFNLGLCYVYGDGVGKDYAKAVEWFRKAALQGDVEAKARAEALESMMAWADPSRYAEAAEKGDAEAQYNLGMCYGQDENGNKDYAMSAKWLGKAATQGHAKAQFTLAWCYQEGNGVRKDAAKAFELYGKAAEQGLAEGQYALGWCYEEGMGVTKDMVEAIRWYRKAAEQGSAQAQYALGKCYEKGTGISKNLEEAAQWYEKAAEQGHHGARSRLQDIEGNDPIAWFKKHAALGDAGAQFGWGMCYATGEGVEKDIAKALEWVEKAAAQGHRQAQESLQQYKEKGTFFSEPKIEASHYREAAEQGDAQACYMLSMCYSRGIGGVEKNVEKGIEWLTKAADQGHAQAQWLLGVRYQNAEGVDRDFVKAVTLFKQSADQNFAEAQFMLGVAYQYGVGVKKDVALATEWFEKAAAQDNEDAREKLDELQGNKTRNREGK